jgi:hypothetical protein
VTDAIPKTKRNRHHIRYSPPRSRHPAQRRKGPLVVRQGPTGHRVMASSGSTFHDSESANNSRHVVAAIIISLNAAEERVQHNRAISLH